MHSGVVDATTESSLRRNNQAIASQAAPALAIYDKLSGRASAVLSWFSVKRKENVPR